MTRSMLELYQAEDCPNSQKVRAAMLEHGLSYVIHNPRTRGGDEQNQQTHEMLEKVGGQDQIPFLVDTNREEAMYESEDIVAYLDEHYG